MSIPETQPTDEHGPALTPNQDAQALLPSEHLAIVHAVNARGLATPEREQQMEGPSSLSEDSDDNETAKHPSHLKDKDMKFSEHEIRVCTTTDSVRAIKGILNKPEEKCRFRIPLCRLKSYPKVRPVLEADVQKLQNEFTRGYREGDRVMYVSLFDEDSRDLLVSPEIVSTWDEHWVNANTRFEDDLCGDVDLHQFQGKMFYVYEGNHRLTAWMREIAEFHQDDPSWHMRVDCIVLDARGKNGVLVNAMADVNW